MDTNALLHGLVLYLCFIPILTFHEFAHAWVAWKCGDPTARDLGRVTLNPIAHIDAIGTVVLPLLAVTLGAAGSGLASFIIGWGKPVPVNIANLRHRRRDDTLVALAGPAMNVVLAIVVMAIARLALAPGGEASNKIAEAGVTLATLSLFLCFFNLLPVPPLDGSHVLKNFIGMSEETYLRLCQFGFIAVILVIQIPVVRETIGTATFGTLKLIAKPLGL